MALSIGYPLWAVCWLWLLSCCSRVIAQTITASNLTTDLPSSGTTRFFLNGSFLGTQSMRLVPLTETLTELSDNAFESFNITGNLVNTNPNTISSLKDGDIAYLSCDDSAYDDGVIGASWTFETLSTNDPLPEAIILYSETDNHCNYSTSGRTFDATFTTVDPMVARVVADRNTSSSNSFSIYPDLSALSTSSSGGNSTASGSSSSSGSGNSSEPTTATAMIILYAITGIITALFLVIIVTGAIRAHRHPERYGPRNVIGRARQSRARGIARAMLETIPIVKFGDPDPLPPKPAEDVEMGASSNQGHEGRTTDGARDAAVAEESTADSTDSDDKIHSRQNSITNVAVTRPDGTDENGNLGCPICTEDFAKGQEVRVLPCNHKFHPDCVDPWLLNVSGTCPLCRTNLGPDESEEHADDENPSTDLPSTSDLAPPLEAEDATRRRPISSLAQRISARRMSRMTPEERLAAVRRLNADGNVEGRPRLSERVRSRLGINTRRQGDDSSTSTPPSEPVAETSTPRAAGTEESTSSGRT